MTGIYRQSPRAIFNMFGKGGVQPGSMSLVESYGFARGVGVGPSFAPNSQLLPEGWATFDPAGVLIGTPWIDVARQEAAIAVAAREPEEEGSPYANAGTLRRAPALAEYWIYTQCGALLFEGQDDTPDDEETALVMAGLALFVGAPNEDPPFPDATSAFATAGVQAQSGGGSALVAPTVIEWSTYEALSVTKQVLTNGGRQMPYVRARVVNGETMKFWFSDDGEHWISLGNALDLSGGEVQWLGLVGTGFGSIATLGYTQAVFGASRAIEIYQPADVDGLNEMLATQGGAQQV